MAWVTPVTNRADGSAMMTASDMDRITGNIDYLFNYATTEGLNPEGSTISKTSWTLNDIIELDFWTEMLEVINNLCAAVYIPEVEPNYQMDWENINHIEDITNRIYYIIGQIGNLQGLNHWAGDDLYAGDPVNAGGTYNG